MSQRMLSEYEKEYIIREAQVKQINAMANKAQQQAYRTDEFFLKEISLNEEDDIPLSEKELEEINKFWEPYAFAFRNNPEIQRVFSRMSGKFNPAYISWGLQFHMLISFWETKLIRTLTLKHNAEWFFNNVPMPRTYVLCEWGGKYFDSGHVQITKKDAVEILYNVLGAGKKVLIKPSDGVCGQGIMSMKPGASKQEIDGILTQYGDSFLCQEFIRNHESYRASVALNTLRITTFYHNNEVYWIGTMFRMAMTSDTVDNWHHGGIACPVDEAGVCADYAVSLNGKRFYMHPSGYEFAGRKLFNYEEAIRTVKDLHRSFPMVNYIAWDVAINEEGKPLILEFGNPGDAAIMQAGGFEIYHNHEYTKEVLDKCLGNYFYSRAIMDWNYREYMKNIALTKYCGFDEVVHIPSEINGKKVTYVYNGALSDSRIKEIHVPETVNMDTRAISVPNVTIIHYGSKK